jgi:hypothetical protein
MPIRIQRRRTKGWRKPSGAIYAGRGSRYGNPFIVGKDGDRGEVVTKYEILLRGNNSLLEDIKTNLKGKDLMCFCSLDEVCHVDTILRLANE